MPQAARSETSTARVFVIDDTSPTPVEVFEVIGIVDSILSARTSFLFEVGEELRVRIEQDGVFEATARVRGHVGPPDAPITELELGERTEVRS